MDKIKFIIAGSGWRSLYYVRVAKALPEIFELCAMYCRTEEKAQKIAGEHHIHTTTSIDECMNYKVDFVVVVVNKASIAEVSMEWMQLGFTVLCETPAAMDVETLNKLWDMHNQGYKLVVAEQYTSYPEYSALLKVIDRNIIGEPDCLNISLAHEYHGASLMRALLKITPDMEFAVSAKTYQFPTTETLTRYDSYKDGRVADKKRTVAAFEFANGKAALYDFDSEQYRSPIRKNTLKLQGCRGEIIDRAVYYLDEKNEPRISEIQIEKRTIETEYENPNLHRIEEVTAISFENDKVYTPVFGLCGLAQDETAIASLMKRTADYSRGNAAEPYPLKDALQDAYMAILLRKADETQNKISSSKQAWHFCREFVIRQAKSDDLEEIANLEKLCFPEGEAASKASFSERLSAYANHFWLLEKDGHIISMVNGMVTDNSDLQDEMYHNAKLHNEQGRWQMIFGVATHPKYQNKGYAAVLLNRFIEEAKLQERKGLVLTCKERLIHYYGKFGFENEGISASEHGDAVWYQMRLKFL